MATNRNFGRLAPDHRIVYAPTTIWFADTLISNPTADQYASAGWLPVMSAPPSKAGVTYTPTEYGDIVGIVIVRRYVETPLTPPVPVYSVEEVIYGLIIRQKLQPVKAVLGDLYDLITMRDVVSADNKILVAESPKIKAALIAKGILTEDEIAEILKEAEV